MAEPITTAVVAHVAPAAKATLSRVLGGKLAEQFNEYWQERKTRWWDTLVEKLQVDPQEGREDLENRLIALASHDDTVRVVNQAFRALLDSVDDAVLPALAALTAEYLSSQMRPDAFFRAMCRILADLSFEEFKSLQTVMKWAALAKAGDDRLQIKNDQTIVQIFGETPNRDPRTGLFDLSQGYHAPPPVHHAGVWINDEEFGEVDHFSRLTALFQSNGFEVLRGTGIKPQDTIILPRTVAQQIHRLIGSPQPPNP